MTPAIERTRCLGGILNDGKSVSFSQGHDFIEVRWLPEDIDDNHRLCPRSEDFANRLGRQAERLRVDIRKYRNRTIDQRRSG